MITPSSHGRVPVRQAPGLAHLRLILLLLGGVFATGVHWDALQVFAWGRMVAVSLEDETPAEAIATLLSPEKRCEICRVVSDAKAEASDGLESAAGFIKSPLLIPSIPPIMVFAPLGSSGRRWVESQALAPNKEAPPVPPPRVVA
ncbi:MAG: hypothetical protein HS122_17065 [Opitutaceae bacterium]|nr:hypothetical protein [Opitutaceae bacterium]